MQPHELHTLAQWLQAEVHPATLGGELVGPGVVIDSRHVSPGALFIALPGEHVDGHDFVALAHQSGAAASIVSRLVSDTDGHPVGRQLVVDDPIAALSELAKRLIDQAHQRGLLTMAITGSSGKTSTKDLLAQVLEAAGPTVAPVGSFNNEIGVPLTACRVDDGSRYLVSEMGARGQGHIGWLCSLTPPQISAVLNVGTAHLGEFGSVEAIAAAKGEIVEALPATGWAVLNADDPRVAAMASRTSARIAWFSCQPPQPGQTGLFVHAEQVEADDLQRHSFQLIVTVDGHRQSRPVSMRLLGAHQVPNALAAATIAICAGLDPAQVAAGLSAAGPRSRWRMELTERADGVAIINDAYNANPDSMAAALTSIGEAVAARKRHCPSARGIAIVGDMLELGPDSDHLHRALGAVAVTAGFDLVLAIGDRAGQVVAGAAEQGGLARVVTVEEACSLDLLHGDVVLVKASRGLALERVAERLTGTTDRKSGEQ